MAKNKQSVTLEENNAKYYCNCDYCTSPISHLVSKLTIENESTSKNERPKETAEKSSLSRKCSRSSLAFLKRSQSLNFISSSSESNQSSPATLEYNIGHELANSNKQHHFCFYYYNLWQSEMFKARAFERDNEKLERQVRLLQAKLERETAQQINISLKWRRTVVTLIEENTKLKAASTNAKVLP